MPEIIALIILIVSTVGLVLVIYRKLPLVLRFPESPSSQFSWKDFFAKVKNFNPFKNFSSEIFLQKVLARIRILILKTDNQTSLWLQSLRKKSQKNKVELSNDYWQKVKKSTKNKSK